MKKLSLASVLSMALVALASGKADAWFGRCEGCCTPLCCPQYNAFTPCCCCCCCCCNCNSGGSQCHNNSAPVFAAPSPSCYAPYGGMAAPYGGMAAPYGGMPGPYGYAPLPPTSVESVPPPPMPPTIPTAMYYPRPYYPMTQASYVPAGYPMPSR